MKEIWMACIVICTLTTMGVGFAFTTIPDVLTKVAGVIAVFIGLYGFIYGAMQMVGQLPRRVKKVKEKRD